MSMKLRVGLPVHAEGLNQMDCRDVFTFWDDFLESSVSTSVDVARWKSTVDGTDTVPAMLEGTDASQELAGGIIKLSTSATDSKQSNMLANGESFQIATGHELYFECRFLVTDTDTGCFVGLSDSDVSAIAALGNGMGFLTLGAALYTSVAKTTANLDLIPGITIAANTWYTVSFHYDGATAITFRFGTGAEDMREVNQLHLTTTLDYIPDDIMLTPTLEAEQQGGAAAAMYVDYVLCQQARQRVAD